MGDHPMAGMLAAASPMIKRMLAKASDDELRDFIGGLRDRLTTILDENPA